MYRSSVPARSSDTVGVVVESYWSLSVLAVAELDQVIAGI